MILLGHDSLESYISDIISEFRRLYNDCRCLFCSVIQEELFEPISVIIALDYSEFLSLQH